MAKALVGKRIIAYLIDGVITTAIIAVPMIAVLGLTFVLGMVAPKAAGVVGLVTIPVGGLCLLAGMAYFLVKDGIRKGQSFGKKFMKLKVVKGSQPAGIVDSIVRNILMMISPINLIEVVLIFVDAEGMRIGDKIMKTKVVEA